MLEKKRRRIRREEVGWTLSLASSSGVEEAEEED